MTALGRRLDKVASQLGPTQIAVHWLLEAQQHGSIHAYAESLHEHPERNPLETLPRQVAAAVRQRTKGQAAGVVEEQVKSAMLSALTHFFVVSVINEHLAHERHVDEMELELLETTLDCLVHGCAPTDRLPQWIARISRLTSETQTWQSASTLVGRCYFTGHTPLFADAVEHLDEVATACSDLIDRYHADILKAQGRRARRIDRAALLRAGAARAEEVVSLVIDRAQQEARVLTAQQEGTFRLGSMRRLGSEERLG